MRTITFKFQRFDGEKQWMQSYQLPYEPKKTLLGMMNKIREDQDPTLNFTRACRHAICGSCAVQVNGNAYLACNTQLDEILETYESDEVLLEPLNNFEVIRDLVVKWEPKEEKLRKVKPWIINDHDCKKDCKPEGHIQTEEEFHKISAPTDCIMCGVCTSECNQLALNDGDYLDPFVLNRAYRYAVDSRDTSPQEHIDATLENELWKCLHCMQCVSKCPKKIPLTDEIAYLRKQTMEVGQMKNQGAKHAYAFYNDIKNTGKLNETLLPIRTDGLIKTGLTKAGFAMRMVAAGKMNPLHMPKKVDGIEGVRELYKYAQEIREIGRAHV